jgi:exonuclease VII small subunit
MCEGSDEPMDKDFELYKLAISDEQYYREMFNARLSYHTNILLAILTAIGAGYIQAKTAEHFLVIALVSVFFTGMTILSKKSLQRIYDHFVEMLRFREELEVRLGLRTLDSIGTPALSSTSTLSQSPKFWSNGQFFKEKWTQSREKIGYFARMKQMFIVFVFIGVFSALLLFIKFWIETNPKPRAEQIETINKRLDVLEKRLGIEGAVNNQKQQLLDINVLNQTLTRVESKIDSLERKHLTLEETLSHHESVLNLDKHLDRHLRIINSNIRNIK